MPWHLRSASVAREVGFLVGELSGPVESLGAYNDASLQSPHYALDTWLIVISTAQRSGC